VGQFEISAFGRDAIVTVMKTQDEVLDASLEILKMLDGFSRLDVDYVLDNVDKLRKHAESIRVDNATTESLRKDFKRLYLLSVDEV